MTDKPHKPKGRPTGYREEYNAIALRVCAMFGATDEDLAKVFDTTVNPINEWKRKNPDFRDAIHKGKEMFDTGKVEDSLLKRALGYQIEEVHQEKDAEGNVTGEKVVKKWVISDTAILFWLKNRNPKRWRDLKAVELSNKDGEAFKTATLTAEMTAEEATKIYSQVIKGEG